MKNKSVKFSLLLLILMLLSCNFLQGNSAPNDSNTPRQLIADNDYKLGGRIYYEQAGFSFKPYQHLGDNEINLMEIDNEVQSISIKDREFSFYFYGAKTDDRFKSTTDMLDYWIPTLMENEPEKVIATRLSEYPVIVDNINGTAVELSIEGEEFIKGIQFSGEVIALQVSNNQYLLAYGFSNKNFAQNNGAWYVRGKKIFESMMSTVVFLK